jgi:hypothetical protein
MGSNSLNCGHCHWLHGGSYLIKKKQKEKKKKIAYTKSMSTKEEDSWILYSSVEM